MSDEPAPQVPLSTKEMVDITQRLVGSQELSTTIEPVEKITSKNDWAPMHKRVMNGNEISSKKRSKATGGKRDEYFQSWSYKALRYPILIPILIWLSFLTILYLFLRVYIALYERFFRWTGKKGKLRRILRHSKNYQEWVENAIKLDDYLGLSKWKKKEHFYYYDYDTLKVTVEKLKALQAGDNIEELMFLLQSCIKANFAGTENPLLYSQTYFGTKAIVEEYNREVTRAIGLVIDDTTVSPKLKKSLFKSLNRNFGRTALCLSGGATMAYNHFGVIKALLENDVLPDIISGTSGGGIVAALAATRTNDELRDLLKPELANRITACEEGPLTYIPRWWKTGARFDAVDWAEKATWFTMGSMTFKEIYEKTGKILNISTVPADPHSPVILCNHITAPNCVVWSTLLASSAVPGVLNPVVLMMKDPKTEELIPFSFGTKFKDGSLRTDIPVEALNTYYNVKFSVVSQVNPHISLFYFAPKGSVGRPVSRSKTGLRGGFIGAGLESFIKLENRKWLQLIRKLDLLPHLMDQDWSNLWLQNFSGTVSIFPKLNPLDLRFLLSDPDEKRLEAMIENGQSATYPKLHFIKHRLNIERKIIEGLKKYKAAVRESTTATTATTTTTTQSRSMGTFDRGGFVFSDSEDESRVYDLNAGVEGMQYQVRLDKRDDHSDDDSENDEDDLAGDDNEFDLVDEPEDDEAAPHSSMSKRRRSAWW